MIYELIIPGTLPGLNEYIDTERGTHGAQTAARLKRVVQERIGWCIAQQLRSVQVRGIADLHFLWLEPSKRRDKDNIAFAKKFILDAMVESGLLGGDGWKHIGQLRDDFAVDKECPRVIVRIEERQEGDECTG